MQGTRQEVLEALKERGRASVSDLAEAVGVKSVTVRHHLNALQADGLLDVQEERQPVGRPRHIYSLSEDGQSLFPQKYHVLVERMLDQLKDTSSVEVAELFLQQLGEQVGDVFRRNPALIQRRPRHAEALDPLERELPGAAVAVQDDARPSSAERRDALEYRLDVPQVVCEVG